MIRSRDWALASAAISTPPPPPRWMVDVEVADDDMLFTPALAENVGKICKGRGRPCIGLVVDIVDVDDGCSGGWVLPLDGDCANVPANKFVTELALVDANVEEKANACIALYLPWVGVEEYKLVFGWVVCSVMKRGLLWLLDGDDVRLFDCWVAREGCHHDIL